MLFTGEKAEEANRGGTDVPDTSISDLLYTIYIRPSITLLQSQRRN